jgi:hypothetical protein
MPKRVLDGEALWGSNKLDNVEPDWARAEYAWIYALAFSNGVFEANPRAIWVRCYAYNRPEITFEDVEVILAAFVRAKLLFVWVEGGKRWGYWTGSDKPGRLPRESWRKRDAARGKLGPDPPEDQLRAFLNGGLTESARSRRGGGTPEACNLDGGGVLGSGSGFGSGFGSGKTTSSQEKATCDNRNHPKKLSKKNQPKESQDSEEATRLAELLLVRVGANLKRLNVNSKLLDSKNQQQASVERWVPDIELMLRLDGYSEAEVRALIEWAQADSFWWKNIRSGRKLREKAEELSLRMKDEQARKADTGRRQKPLDQQFEEVERRRAGQGVN